MPTEFSSWGVYSRTPAPPYQLHRGLVKRAEGREGRRRASRRGRRRRHTQLLEASELHPCLHDLSWRSCSDRGSPWPAAVIASITGTSTPCCSLGPGHRLAQFDLSIGVRECRNWTTPAKRRRCGSAPPCGRSGGWDDGAGFRVDR